MSVEFFRNGIARGMEAVRRSGLSRTPKAWAPSREKKEGYAPDLETLKMVAQGVVEKAKTDRAIREKLLSWAGLPPDSKDEFRWESPSPTSATIVYGEDKPAKRAATLLAGDSENVGFMGGDRASEIRVFKWRPHKKLRDKAHAVEVLSRFILEDEIKGDEGEVVEKVDISKEALRKKMDAHRGTQIDESVLGRIRSVDSRKKAQ